MSTKLRLIGISTRGLLAVLCAVVIAPGDTLAYALSRQVSSTQTAAPQTEALISPDQLDSLVAPIALYPDPLLAQTLAASTYPLEILQLRQWLDKHHGLTGTALANAVEKQPWDPSVQAMAGLPDVVTFLANDIQWTTDLGNAVLAQESDVMNAVQRMRQKAMNNGTLKSTPQQVVETTVVESRPAIVIEQANPEVVYVPSYNPTVVYGAASAYYPYPPIYYPSPGYYAAGAAISFGVGVAMGAFWGGGGWGWNTGWGGGNINVNNNNFFNRNANVRAGNLNAARTGNWQHAAQHRGNVAYGNRATAQRYGGTARGASTASRQANARQQLNRQGGAVGTAGQRGNLSGQRTGAGVSNRASGAARGNGNYAGRAGGAGSVGTGANRGNLGAGGANRGSVGTSGASRGNYGGSGSRGSVGAGGANRGSVGTSGHRSGGGRSSMGGGGHRSGGGGRGGGSRGGGGRGGGGGGRGGGRR